MKPIASLLASFCSPGTLRHVPDSHAGKYHHLSPSPEDISTANKYKKNNVNFYIYYKGTYMEYNKSN